MHVLDQYQSRLHEAGNEEHDEEIEYVRQIVASPIFHQFLRGETAQEENIHIQQASRDVLSAEISTEALLRSTGIEPGAIKEYIRRHGNELYNLLKRAGRAIKTAFADISQNPENSDHTVDILAQTHHFSHPDSRCSGFLA